MADSTKKFLDQGGVTYLWGKIKAAFTGAFSYAKSNTTDDYILTGEWKSNVPGETTTEKAILTVDATPTARSSNPVQSQGVKTALDNKVDKVTGKALSTNDFTNAYKTKLNGISVKVNNEAAQSADANGQVTLTGIVKKLTVNGTEHTPTDGVVTLNTTDTKNTAGTLQSSEALYLIGAKEQTTREDDGKTTYSNKNVYMKDGKLYVGCTPQNPNDDKTVVTQGDMPGVANTSNAGLMSAADKKKLDTIAIKDVTVPTTVPTGTHGGTVTLATITTTEGNAKDIKITLPADSDTKNTAGATNSQNKKLFLVGAEMAGDSQQTYTNAQILIGSDNKLHHLSRSSEDVNANNALVTKSELDVVGGRVTTIEGMINADSNGTINKFNEIVDFLAGYTENDTLQSLINGVANSIEALENDDIDAAIKA